MAHSGIYMLYPSMSNTIYSEEFMLEWVYSIQINKRNTEVPPPSHNPSPFYTHPSHTCQFIPCSGTCDRQGARLLKIKINKEDTLFCCR